jgi:S1-C subfamily serine protease
VDDTRDTGPVVGPGEEAQSEAVEPAATPRADSTMGNLPRRPGLSRRAFAGGVAAAVIVGSLLGGAGGAALVAQRVEVAQAAPARVLLAQPIANPAVAGVDIPTIYRAVAPSVVTVQVSAGQSGRQRATPPTSGEGTGFIVDQEGHVLTNAHVVSGASAIRLLFQDGSTVPATVVGSDTGTDIALLKADIPASKLAVVMLGDSSKVQPGDTAIAIGSPFGLDHSVTAGIVSAVNRDWGNAGGRPMRGLLQVDTPINPGNSGGPLLNTNGEVIGITAAIESPVRGSVGVGFAVPINTAKALLPKLSQGATIDHPWLGISGMPVTAEVAAAAGLKVETGVLVMQVAPDSPAANAGLKPAMTDASTDIGVGDVITAVDGHTVAKVTDISSYLDTLKVGDSVDLSIVRGDAKLTVKAVLAAWPASLSS